MKYETRKVMFSSKNGRWETPNDLFQQLNEEFHLTLDVCAEANTTKLPRYFHGDSGLHYLNSWKGERCWMNPPYGREIGKWIFRAWNESFENGTLTVALLPARTDTNWFWDYCINQEIRLIKGRLKFSDHKNSAPFPSMIVIWK